LKVRAELDRNYYPNGVEVTGSQPRAVPLSAHGWHSDSNYTINTTRGYLRPRNFFVGPN
jgi:hypothetical protein